MKRTLVLIALVLGSFALSPSKGEAQEAYPIRPPKGYSPTRRWLRAERAREHKEAIAPDVETVMDWRPSRASAVEIASRRWINIPIPAYLLPHQDVDTSTDETVFYTGQGRIE